MKSNYTAVQAKKQRETKNTLIIGIIILVLQIIFHLSVGAQSPLDTPIKISDSIKNEMGRQLNDVYKLDKILMTRMYGNR